MDSALFSDSTRYKITFCRAFFISELIFSLMTFLLFSGNGYIEGTELDGFLREFVSSANTADVSPEVLYIDIYIYHDVLTFIFKR